MEGNLLFTAVEMVGMVAFALYGALVGLKYRLDLFGILLMGITAWLSLPADGWQSTLYFIVALLSMLSVILSLRPMNVLRFVVCVLMIAGFFAAVILFPSLLQLTNTAQVSFLLPWVLISALAMELLVWLLLRRKA